MKINRLVILCLAGLLGTPFIHSQSNMIKVLAVTGGHWIEEKAFYQMFDAMENIKCDYLTTEEMQSLSVDEIDRNYDVLVFLDMVKAEIAPSAKAQFLDLAKRGKGMLFLHFTIASRPFWDEYHQMVGGKFHLPKFTEDKSKASRYYKSLEVKLNIVDPNHPITQGLEDFTLTDTFYDNIEVYPGVTPLLTTTSAKSCHFLGWTHVFKNSEIVYILPGYTAGSFADRNYRVLILNSIEYLTRDNRENRIYRY